MPLESTNVPNEKASFMAAISGLAPAASATDIFTITGKAGRVVKINQIQISGIATAASAIPISIVKRSTVNSGGTSAAVSAVLMDTANAGASPAAASVLSYTANPASLGTSLGNIATARMILSTASASVGTSPIVFAFERMYMKLPTLRNETESLCLNYGGATAAGNSVDISISWTEEAQ
jgi:hypothetical protein